MGLENQPGVTCMASPLQAVSSNTAPTSNIGDDFRSAVITMDGPTKLSYWTAIAMTSGKSFFGEFTNVDTGYVSISAAE